MTTLLLLVALAMVSAIGTAIVARYALTRSILDIPNERSSHTIPTPRGGGIAIVATTLAAVALFAAFDRVDARLALAFVGGGLAVAAVGWWDDRHALGAGTRALVHFLAAAWFLWLIGGMPGVRLGATPLHLGIFGHVVAAIGIVWMINLFNFMDGIDGIAASEAAVVAGFCGLLLAGTGYPGLALVAGALAAASLGFLSANWPPASIFMGDAGSGFLGFGIAALALASERAHALSLVAWLVVAGVFVFDATVTLVRRVLRGERWYAAHRSHAYQRAVQAGWSHRAVTSTVIAIGLVLGVLAFVTLHSPHLTWAIVLVATLFLAVIYVAVERVRPMTSAPEPHA